MEQRKLPRSKLTSLIKVINGSNIYFGETVDISLSGLSCRLPLRQEDVNPLLVSFRLDIKDRPITSWAVPTWATQDNDGKYRVGLKFIELNPSDRAKISDFVSANRVPL